MVLSDKQLKHNDVILNPVAIQTRFRNLVDQSFKDMSLPNGWEHGGCNRPECSGIRCHGPATMIQLIYRTKTDEYKINVDITLGTNIFIIFLLDIILFFMFSLSVEYM